MTVEPHDAQVVIRRYESEAATAVIDEIAAIYAEVYREPPYLEGPDDVASFVAGWPRRVAQPGFRLVIADHAGIPVGFSFGHQLTPDTKWWAGAVTPLPSERTREYPGRTFAIIELAVRSSFRRRGVGRALHDALLAERTEDRATLLARHEAEAAQLAYQAWGYRYIGRIKPGTDTPTYDALMRDLPRESHPVHRANHDEEQLTVRPERCLARIQLGEDQVEWLSERPYRAHQVKSYPYCELEIGHPGPHAALGQQGNEVEWWILWTLVASEIIETHTCPSQSHVPIEGDDEPYHCLLFQGHSGRHSYELQQNIRHTV